jgi:hypothetical protein
MLKMHLLKQFFCVVLSNVIRIFREHRSNFSQYLRENDPLNKRQRYSVFLTSKKKRQIFQKKIILRSSNVRFDTQNDTLFIFINSCFTVN